MEWKEIDYKDLSITLVKNGIDYKDEKTSNGYIIGSTRWPLLWVPGGDDIILEFFKDEPVVEWYIDVEKTATEESVIKNLQEKPIFGICFRLVEAKRPSGYFDAPLRNYAMKKGAIQYTLLHHTDDHELATELVGLEGAFFNRGKDTMGVPVVKGIVRMFEVQREELIDMIREFKNNGKQYNNLSRFSYMTDYYNLVAPEFEKK